MLTLSPFIPGAGEHLEAKSHAFPLSRAVRHDRLELARFPWQPSPASLSGLPLRSSLRFPRPAPLRTGNSDFPCGGPGACRSPAPLARPEGVAESKYRGNTRSRRSSLPWHLRTVKTTDFCFAVKTGGLGGTARALFARSAVPLLRG
jgi:hypothetical protein